MQIAVLLAVVTAVTISENAPHRPVSLEMQRLALALGAMGLVVLFAAAGSVAVAAALRADRASCAVPLKWFERLQRVHALLWLEVVAVVLYRLNWAQLVRYNWGLDRVVLLRDVLVFLPVWLPWVLSWAAFYEVERSVQRTLCPAADSAARYARVRFAWSQTRQGLGLILIPVLALLAVEELVGLWTPDWLRGGHRWWLHLALLLAIVIAFPAFLKRLWDTTPMADSLLRGRLWETSFEFGIGCREFRVWNTDYRILNAAVAGFVPAMRYVFFTDALLKHLDDGHVEAVLLHELGHVRRHHLPLRMLLLGLPLWFFVCFHLLAPRVIDPLLGGDLSMWQAGLPPLAAIWLPVALTIYAMGTLAWYSRWLEFDADLCVLEQRKTVPFIGALYELARLSGKPTRHRSWLHPSVDERVRRLLLAEARPDHIVHFRRRLDCVAGALLLAWLAIPWSAIGLAAWTC